MPGENENHRNISHHGIKQSQGYGAHVDVSGGNEMARGGVCGSPINADPHQGGPRSNVYMPRDRTPVRGDPASMTPPHTAQPHRAAADPGPRESVVVTPRSRP